jgi:hypothetical protein
MAHKVPKTAGSWSKAFHKRGSLPAERAADDLLRLLDDGGEMVGAFQALGIKFVDVLRARGARGEPAAG